MRKTSIINLNYAKDTTFVYYKDKEIEGAAPLAFQLFNEDCSSYSKDKNNVYYKHKRIMEADLASFEVSKYCSAKDKNYEYSLGKIQY